MAVRSSWKKSDSALVDRFHAVLPDHPAAERRTMFGYPCSFVNGHFFAGLHEDRVVIRLPADLRSRFPELADAPTFDPMGTGRGMKDWYEIPPAVASDDVRLAGLLATAIDEVAQLPPKEPKPPK